MAGNTRKTIWWPGSTRTRWGSLQRSPRPLDGLQGEGQGGRGKEEREKEKWEGEGKDE